MSRTTGRTEDCNRPQAAVRLTHARAFLEVADLVSDVDDELANDNVAAALAVLAGIAAADAACCVTLGRAPADRTTASRSSSSPRSAATASDSAAR